MRVLSFSCSDRDRASNGTISAWMKLASSVFGPGAGGQGRPSGDGKPEGPDRPLEKGVGGIDKSSSDDRPGPGICGSKYVEDAKAARSVRVWDRVPMKNIRSGGLNKS